MWKKRICILLSFLMVITGVFPIGFNVNGTVTVSASGISNEETGSTQEPGSGQEEQAATGGAIDEALYSQGNLRLIFTTDIHGQFVNYNYQTGKYLNRGLNKVYTMIQAAREIGRAHV